MSADECGALLGLPVGEAEPALDHVLLGRRHCTRRPRFHRQQVKGLGAGILIKDLLMQVGVFVWFSMKLEESFLYRNIIKVLNYWKNDKYNYTTGVYG